MKKPIYAKARPKRLGKPKSFNKKSKAYKSAKRKADKKFEVHVVQQGESMQQISQIYGIKLKRLYKLNNLPEGIQVVTGTKLKLR